MRRLSARAEIDSPVHLRATSGAESTLRRGHPWLYAESILKQDRPGRLGQLAVIYDRQDRFLALGLFDPHSPLRVRILQFGSTATIDEAWWLARLDQAVEKRRALFDAQTTGYRWLNGESDGWPGLVLDRYADTLVVKLYTAAWLCRLQEVAGLIRERFQPERIVLRLSRNIAGLAEREFKRQDGEVLAGTAVTQAVVFQENGLRFEAEVLHGQKTGFFLDQRENRRRVEALARGRRVLNAFSFSGGFSVYAARGGARSVTDVDISGHALRSGDRNFGLNKSVRGIGGCRRETIRADVFEWLTANAERPFDLIVLDPPSMAKRQSERLRAMRAYDRLVRLGTQHLSAGGILVACSCSAHVGTEQFFGTVRKALLRSGRSYEEIQTTRHAADHPANFAEAEYLKAIYCRIN